MTTPANIAGSYQKIATETATPGQLIAMLFDGAIRFLDRALVCFESPDPLEFNQGIHNNVRRAQAIIHELNASLNMEAGGELARVLRRLYLYFDMRLHESNIYKRPQGIREVIERLTVLRDAWTEMLQRRENAASGS
ncbi:MAG TPA: flagellar export chaperone FliS [Verrucomicrobiae bacterium]|nr:flagellar export chaperone FliS [Verrucomicrobiae bacterium]